MFGKKRNELQKQLADIDLNEQAVLDEIEVKVNDYREALVSEYRDNAEMDRNEINLKLEFLDELEQDAEDTEATEAIEPNQPAFNPNDVNGNL